MAMPPGYGLYQQPQQNQAAGGWILSLLPWLQDRHVNAKLDAAGALLNDFKAQWNAQFPAHLITAKDYDPTL